MPDNNEVIMQVVGEHFLGKFREAYARVTGDSLDAFFVTPTKAIAKLGDWINNELQDDELRAKILAAMPGEELDNMLKKSNKMIAAIYKEIDSRG